VNLVEKHGKQKRAKETFKLFFDTLLAVNEEKEKKGHGTENVAFLLGENVFFAGCKSFPHRGPIWERSGRVIC
jgi:hypothetical protein